MVVHGGIALSKDGLFLRKRHNLPALTDGREECMGVKIAPLLTHRTGTHQFLPSQNSTCQLGWSVGRDIQAEDFRSHPEFGAPCGVAKSLKRESCFVRRDACGEPAAEDTACECYAVTKPHDGDLGLE